MKSGSHLLQRLWCECHVPAAHPNCGVPVGYLWPFYLFPSTRDVLGHLWEVVATHALSAELFLATKLLI